MRLRWMVQSKRIPSDVDEVVDIVLSNRGVSRSDFLNISIEKLQQYMNIKNFDDGVRLILSHLVRGSKITIVGDYDCDGITSAAQWTFFLRDIGYSNFDVIIPTRDEGYGIPERAVERSESGGLVIAVDCGTHDREVIDRLRSAGCDVLVIDHHEVKDSDKVASATVLINPKQQGCPSRFKELCSSGLTLLFLVKLRQALPSFFPRPVLDGRFQSLAAIGTIADVMPLIEANRIIVASGLSMMGRNRFAPATVLRKAAGVENKSLSSGMVGFYLAPRLNAAGRVGDPMMAYKLLTATRISEMEDIARTLNQLNARRQAEEERVIRCIASYLTSQPFTGRTLVVAGKGWHPGVLGIVASRVIQRYHYGPVIVGSVGDNGVIKASARSVPGFDVCDALSHCDDLLIKWGGHESAAGLSLEVGNLREFQERFEDYAARLPDDVFQPKLCIDATLPSKLVSNDLVEALNRLEPYGPGNPRPLFLTKAQRITNVKAFGNKHEHLNIEFNSSISAVFWRGCKAVSYIKPSLLYNVVYHLEEDSYRGSIRMVIQDIRPFSDGGIGIGLR